MLPLSSGLDVHARSIKAVALDVDDRRGQTRRPSATTPAAVAEWTRSVDPAARVRLRVGRDRVRPAEEALGAGRQLRHRRGVQDDKAIGRPTGAGRTIATTPSSWRRMLSVGNVVEVWVPDDECEAARDLARALDDAREDLRRRKQRLSKFLLRHGLVFERDGRLRGRGRATGPPRYWAWIRSISFAEKADDDALAFYVDAARQADGETRRALGEAGGRQRRPGPGGRRGFNSLRCLKGIDVMTAADIVFEAGEFARFRNARSFAAWLGLTPSEHSSGEKVAAGRHHQGRQQASEESDGGGGVALPERLARIRRARPRARLPTRLPGGTQSKGVRRLVGEARGPAGARGPQEQGQRRHRARARVLVLGGGPHGRGRAIGLREGRRRTHSADPSHACGPIRGRWGEPQALFLRAPQGATRDTETVVSTEVTPAVATDCPAQQMRHGRILNCEDERRKDTPRSPQDGSR